jgi:hypothetical protein
MDELYNCMSHSDDQSAIDAFKKVEVVANEVLKII